MGLEWRHVAVSVGGSFLLLVLAWIIRGLWRLLTERDDERLRFRLVSREDRGLGRFRTARAAWRAARKHPGSKVQQRVRVRLWPLW